MKEEYYYWPADLLVRYIVKTHHLEMYRMLPEIKANFTQLITVNGARYPELCEAQALFLHCAQEVEAHFSKEAIAVLPYVRKYTEELKKHPWLRKPGLYSVCPSIHKMYLEHKTEKLRFELLLQLMSEIAIPGKDSFLYETVCQKVFEFRNHWQEQVQLENDILFPKLIEMEAALNAL